MKGCCRTNAATPLLISTKMEFRNSCATKNVRKSIIPGWFGGVARARKIVQWTIFTEQRAGRPWKPLHFKSAAATCAVWGYSRPEIEPVAQFQRITGRQAPGRNFCEAKPAEREQKFIHCAFAARESRRDERQRRGGSRKGVLRARKTGRWPVFTEERAGRPWLCPPAEGCATAPFPWPPPSGLL